MRDHVLTDLREGKSQALGLYEAKYISFIKRAYRNTSSFFTEEIELKDFSPAFLSVTASLSRREKDFEERLERLAEIPEVVASVALYRDVPEVFEQARKRFEEILRRHWQTGGEAYPSLGLSLEAFQRHLLKVAAEVSLRRAVSIETALRDKIFVPDLYLAAAVLVDRESPAAEAREVFSKKYLPLAESYVRKKWRQVPNAEDKISSFFFCCLYEHSLSEKTGNPSAESDRRPPLLSEYRGQAPLAAWLTLSLGNLIRDSIRTSRVQVSIDEEQEVGRDGSVLPKLVLSEEEAQRTHLDRTRCVEILQSGIRKAWERLKPREQLSLTLQTLFDVPPSVIARKVFRVHEGTITKYTTNALKKIRDTIEHHAREVYGLTREEAELCFEYLRDAFPETGTIAGGMVQSAETGFARRGGEEPSGGQG